MVDSIGAAGQYAIPQNTRRVERPRSAEESQSREFKLDNTGASTEAHAATAIEDVQADANKVRKNKEASVQERRSQLTDTDLGDMLLKFKKPVTPQYKQIITALLERNQPITKEALDGIKTLIDGNSKPNSIQAAVIAYSKGLSTSSKGTDLISSFLSHFTSFTENTSALNTSLNQLRFSLSNYGKLFEPSFLSSFSAILSGFGDELKKLTRVQQEGSLEGFELGREKMIGDLKTLLGFLKGVEHQVIQRGADVPVSLVKSFLSDVLPFRQDLSALLDDLLTQMVLTKTDLHAMANQDFAYWLLPNLWPGIKRDIELLIRRQKRGKKSVVLPEKTQIILKFETPEMGEVTIVMDFLDRTISYVFHTTAGDTKSYIASLLPDLRYRMASHNYQLTRVQTRENSFVDVKSLILPTINLNSMTRIITEA